MRQYNNQIVHEIGLNKPYQILGLARATFRLSRPTFHHPKRILGRYCVFNLPIFIMYKVQRVSMVTGRHRIFTSDACKSDEDLPSRLKLSEEHKFSTERYI